MANSLIAFDNVAPLGVLTGGEARPTMPLVNLLTPILGEKWRSLDLSPESTWFQIDLLRPRVMRVIVIGAHNLSLSARYRIRGSNDPDLDPVRFDSGWQDVWPRVYGLTELPWLAENFWTGKYTEAERRGFNWTLPFILPTANYAQHVRVEFDDPGNVAPYVQAGGLFIADAWQPNINVALGVQHAWEDRSGKARSLGGQVYSNEKNRFRVARMTFEHITEEEAMRAFDIDRLMGITGQVFYAHDPADVKHALRRQFIGTFRTLSPVEYPRQTVEPNAKAFEIEEAQ